jgi:hypothetical protein
MFVSSITKLVFSTENGGQSRSEWLFMSQIRFMTIDLTVPSPRAGSPTHNVSESKGSFTLPSHPPQNRFILWDRRDIPHSIASRIIERTVVSSSNDRISS